MLTCLTILFQIFTGCAGEPVATHQKNLYVGNFEVDKKEYQFGTYESLRGVGFRLGFFAFGIGYYDLKVLSLSPEGVYSVRSPLGDVTVGQVTLTDDDEKGD